MEERSPISPPTAAHALPVLWGVLRIWGGPLRIEINETFANSNRLLLNILNVYSGEKDAAQQGS